MYLPAIRAHTPVRPYHVCYPDLNHPRFFICIAAAQLYIVITFAFLCASASLREIVFVFPHSAL